MMSKKSIYISLYKAHEMAAKKTLKRLVINFYDNEQGKTCVEWLEQQKNVSDSIRELIVQAANGKPVQSNDNDPDTDRKADFAYQVAVQIIANGLQAPSKPHHQMVEQPLPVAMKPPAAFGGTKAPPVEAAPPSDGKSDGSAANNLLMSLERF